MTPTPEKVDIDVQPTMDPGVTLDESAIVISGMSGLLPDCHNVMEFANKIYNRQNLVTSQNPRWKCSHPDLAKHHGIIPNLDCFDPQFFMVFHRLSHTMDAITRKLLEHSYQAIFDAGICPSELSGKQVAVIIGAGVNESEKASAYAELYLGILGANRAMYANRISYYLNLKGPSMLVDVESCGSLVALEKAYQAIRGGQCEAAIVGGGNLLLHPQTSLLYHKLLKSNPDGKTKCYDINADGHSSSEAINVIFLQKSKDAKRIYASVRYVKTNFAVPREEMAFQKFSPYREPAVLTKFFREFYSEAGVSPSVVEYIEGNGAAILDADKAELEALEAIFCKDRKVSLAVGSITSNAGNTGAASGLTSIMKVLLGYLKGEMAGTINCDNPRQDVAALRDGRMHIATEHQRFGRSFAAVNHFNITGVNAHVLLEGAYKPKDLSKYYSEIPYLVTVSGRQESSVQKMLDDLKGRPLDAEEIALLRNIHKQRISKHLARGFAIYTENKEKAGTLKEKVDYYDDLQRPLWFVYSGMGSQWAGMGVQLMRIPIFAAAINQCHQVLEAKGINLIDIITNPDQTIFDNILNSFVGIAAIQIGLTDVLRAIGIVPDNIIGHSVGELGCAYADGCLSAEEMILSAYSRGLVSLQTLFIKGSMAAVGMGFKQISNMVPPEIEVACHNGPDSSTISGPADVMREFVAKLTEQGIFAKEVPCSNIAYHSRYIAEAGPSLLKCLREVIKTPRPRSERWLSTSLPEDRWNESLAKYSSAEYHTNNLLSPVLFHETSRLIPSNAVLVEVGPHGLLQAILKRSLPESCVHIPLTRRGHEDNALFLLEAIGQLYMNGYQVDVSALYPKVEFPVSTETRPLSHLVDWYHADKMRLCQYMNVERKQDAVYKPIVTIYDEEYQYFEGNVGSDEKLFPFAGALVFAWETLAMTLGHRKEHICVQFEDITFYTQPPLYDQQPLNLTVTLQRGSGKFEVTYQHGIVVNGSITALQNFPSNDEVNTNEPLALSSNDIYRLFHERGYKYTDQFRSIHSANLDLNEVKLVWNHNWVTFIDGAFQLNVLRRNHNGISQPQYIKSLCINTAEHTKYNDCNENVLISGKFSEAHDQTRCGGLLIKHMSFKDKPFTQDQLPALKEMAFFPYFQEDNVDILKSLYIYLQIISENLNKNVLNVVYVSKSDEPCLLDKITDLLAGPPEININVKKIQKEEIAEIRSYPNEPDFIFVHDLLSDKKVFEEFYGALPMAKFVVSFGVETEDLYPTSLYHQICAVGRGSGRLELAIWRPDSTPNSAAVSVRNISDLQFLKYTRENLLPQQKLLILSSYPPVFGLKDLVKRWRQDSSRNKIHVAMINHEHSKDVDIDALPDFKLAFNVLNHGQWGGECYIPLQPNKVTGENIELQIAQPGNLDSLQWVEANEVTGSGIPVTVHFAGLNVYDAKRASAEISVGNSQNKGFGMDFSGVTDRGERVMGLIDSGAASSKVIVEPELVWPVPKHWSLEDAATVPLAYSLAFYCLIIKCKLIRGMSILIHGGTGAVGQAAIAIALANGCKVFTTVSDIHKKRFLRRRFPELPADHIGNSRNLSFRDMVMSATRGNGCDIVISSTKGELKDASLACCATSGTTLDLVQIHTQENFWYGMSNMTKSRSYVPIGFYSIFTEQKYDEMKKLQLLISEGIVRGYVCPLPRVTYPPEEVSRAIRLLAGSRHRGRVLLRMQESVSVLQPRLTCSPDFCHLVMCDKEGFGLQLAERFIRNGANKMLIHYPNQSSYLDFKIQLFQKLGANIQISTENLSNYESVARMLKHTIRLAPIEGIHVINTGLSSEKSKTKKLSIIANLDSISRELCPYIRYFTIVNGDSSIGQEICLSRAQDCLPSLSLQLHDLEKFNASNNINTLKWQSALNAIVNALHKPVVLAYAKPVHHHSLLEEIAKIPGINISNATCDEITLEQIGIDFGRAQELCNVLAKFNIALPKESIPEMTVAELKKIHDVLASKTKEITGFNGVFNHIEREELLPDLVLMRTRIHTTYIRPDEFDNNLTYLWIVPGIEGHHERFKVLCERLKIPAMVLQPGFNEPDDSVHDMAQRLLNDMMNRLNVQKHFYLLGYEFGVFVALEMADILEKRGLTGTVYCLGGTPEEIQITLNSQLGNMSTNLTQDELLQHMFAVITGSESDKLKRELIKVQSWKEKVKMCLRLMRNHTSHTSQYAEALINTVYQRINMVQNYNLKPLQLKSKIIVLRPNLTAPDSLDTSSGYPKVTIHELDTSLSAVPKHLKCTTIINKYLEPELLLDYQRRNQCETSLINEEMITFSYANY